MLGEAAVNEEKDAIEGTFKQEQVIWGLVMNTATNTVALPERRILKGAHLLTEPEFEAGCYALKLRQLQQFRGIMTGWAVVVRGLRNELKAADLFLTSGDGWHTGRLEFISTEFGEAMAGHNHQRDGRDECSEGSGRSTGGFTDECNYGGEGPLVEEPGKIDIGPSPAKPVVAARRGAHVVGREWT